MIRSETLRRHFADYADYARTIHRLPRHPRLQAIHHISKTIDFAAFDEFDRLQTAVCSVAYRYSRRHSNLCCRTHSPRPRHTTSHRQCFSMKRTALSIDLHQHLPTHGRPGGSAAVTRRTRCTCCVYVQHSYSSTSLLLFDDLRACGFRVRQYPPTFPRPRF